jgi:dihydrofolate synthase/folylpolyglutamate synthase
MAQELQPLSNHFIITSSSHPRAAPISLVAEKFNTLGVKAMVVGNVTEALSKALALAKKTDLILITGSLFVVAEAIDYITKARAPMALDDTK